MTEFSQEHHQSRLLGSPPGYIGHGDKNQLADRIMSNPHCLILLDEIDKASPEIMRLFMQILANGELTDSEGNRLNFRNAIIVMTMNIPAYAKTKSSMGFNGHGKDSDYTEARERLIGFCKTQFSEEFVNRIDDFIPFHGLNEKDLRNVSNMLLERISQRLKNRDVELKIAPAVLDYILSKQQRGQNGWGIRSVITSEIEAIIADNIIGVVGKSTIKLDIVDGKPVAKVALVRKKK